MPEPDPTKVCRDINELAPTFRPVLLAAVSQANRETRGKHPEFAEWVVFETYRSPERQRWLYSQGRTRPGRIVTNVASAGMHGKRLAADVVWRDVAGNLRWDDEGLYAPLWAILGHCARAHGLQWGGDWKSPVDRPHIQVKA